MEQREQIIADYLDGMSIPRIITKYKLYKESQFDGRWKRMVKADVERTYNIDFHLERSKHVNSLLMKYLHDEKQL